MTGGNKTMKKKFIGMFVCVLLLTTAVPVVASLNNGTMTTPPSSSCALRKAFLFGRFSNLTGQSGLITVEAVNLWGIYKEPFSFAHFPRGTQVTFDMYTAYGHLYQKVGLMFLHVELVV